jgi:hypothetical protein
VGGGVRGDTSISSSLTGLRQVTGLVSFADGLPAANVEVRLDGRPATGCQGPCTAFTGADGRFSFIDVPADTYSLSARDPLSGLGGAIRGPLTPGVNDIGRMRDIGGDQRARGDLRNRAGHHGGTGPRNSGTRLFTGATDGTFGSVSAAQKLPLTMRTSRRARRPHRGLSGRALGDIVSTSAAVIIAVTRRCGHGCADRPDHQCRVLGPIRRPA